MSRIRLPNNWLPRQYQQEAWDYLENGGKRAVLCWHRRAGKDDLLLHRTAVAAYERVGNYWHLLPQAKQARKALWDAINPHTGLRRIHEAFPRELWARSNDNEMRIEFTNGSIWQVVGSDNYDSLVGSPPVGLVFSEYPLSDPAAWAYLRPILAENGGWAAFAYTPRGKNHGFALFEAASRDPAWFCQRLTAEQTSVFGSDFLASELRSYMEENGDEAGESLFKQEYLCSFEAAIRGAYYARQIDDAESQGRIGNVPWEPQLKVWTSWDLGFADAMAIWFWQLVGREVRAIDYLENSGVGLEWYAKELQRKPYIYGGHVVPHDAQVHELGTGKSRIEVMRGLGLDVSLAPDMPVQDGIQATRQLLPRVWFDAEKTRKGVHALRSYHAKWNEAARALSLQPAHDWASHGSDSARYFAASIGTMIQEPVTDATANARAAPAFRPGGW